MKKRTVEARIPVELEFPDEMDWAIIEVLNGRINIRFSKALTESMNLVLYSKYPSCVLINAARGVTV